MTTLTDAREGHTESRIALRHAQDAVKDIELALDAVAPLGNNTEQRKAFVAEQRVNSAEYRKAVAELRAAQDAADVAELALQVALDDLNAAKQRTRAKLADVLWALHGTPGVYGDDAAAAMTLDDLVDAEAANLAQLEDYVPGAPPMLTAEYDAGDKYDEYASDWGEDGF